MSLGARLTGIFAFVLLTVVASWALYNRQVDQVFRRAEKTTVEAHGALRLALETQVHFKKQVQEWKNILLRGANDRDFDKYLHKFRNERETVRALTRQLLEVVPRNGPAGRAAVDFSAAHLALDGAYQNGLNAFVQDRNDPFRIDTMVRGIDRQPTDLLDDVVAGTSDWRDESLHEAARQIRTARWNAVLSVAVVVILAMVFTLVALRSWVYRPIVTLTEAARRLADGELGVAVNLEAKGELGLLGQTFNLMSQELADLVSKARHQAALEQELEIAETVQASLIPKPSIHSVDGLEVTGRYLPASRCGGDWWSYFRVSEHETLVLIGDVTGHGVPTTLITASINAYCEELFRTNHELHSLVDGRHPDFSEYFSRRGSLGYLLSQLNRGIAKLGAGRFLMTFSAALIEPGRKRVTYASAGHEAPLVIPAGSELPIQPLYVGPTQRLGEAQESVFFEGSHPFNPGDTIVWYTDGLIDVANPGGKAYGPGRLVRALVRNRAASVDGVTNAVLDDVRRFSKGADFVDDMTLVVLRWPEASGPNEWSDAALVASSPTFFSSAVT